jgi:hypothetical protein
MNPEEFWAEAWRLVAEYDAQRESTTKEHRLYYNEDGTIIGLWETGHPTGENYIVLNDPDVFHRNNTNNIRVVDKQIKIINPLSTFKVRLKKSISGQPVVRGHAAIPVTEEYNHIEYYDYTNN